MSQDADQAVWPVDLDQCRLWPMEGEDGPLLQELFDDLTDASSLWEPGAADAVSTFISLPEGVDYDAKLLVGLWRNGGLAGALDCILGYPSHREWTLGMLVVAERHRHAGIGSSVLGWLESTATEHGARILRVVVRNGNRAGADFLARRGYVRESLGDPVGEVYVVRKHL